MDDHSAPIVVHGRSSAVILPEMRGGTYCGLLLVAAVFLTGCGSTICVESTKHLQPFNGGTRPVHVTNPEIGFEYEVLKASGIYQLTEQSPGARQLTLHPIRQYGRCANSLLLSAITFGIIPGVVPAARAFEYDLETDGVVEPRIHQLPLYERFSIWDRLVKTDEQQVIAEALAWSKSDPGSDNSLQPTSVTPNY